MTVRNVSEAKAQLSALLVLLERGEDVIIARAGKPIARLVPATVRTEPRKGGFLKEKIWISPNFDEPDPEIEEMFYGGV